MSPIIPVVLPARSLQSLASCHSSTNGLYDWKHDTLLAKLQLIVLVHSLKKMSSKCVTTIWSQITNILQILNSICDGKLPHTPSPFVHHSLLLSKRQHNVHQSCEKYIILCHQGNSRRLENSIFLVYRKTIMNLRPISGFMFESEP